ncbi:hypothetical protein BGW80DRAFT_455378 [Lactifluus volemus]|nr:hypothetical protein BGW80DRAFT_455378 [Lactifluus volemus]
MSGSESASTDITPGGLSVLTWKLPQFIDDRLPSSLEKQSGRRLDQALSSARELPEISFTPPQMTFDSQSNSPENDATFNTDDNSRTPGLSSMAETSQQPHEPATPALDAATDLSLHPADTAPPSSVDADRPP